MRFGLVFVPVVTSLILGVVFLAAGDARFAIKTSATAVFLVAVYLQFFSRQVLAGLLAQIVLALGLAVWRKVHAS